MVALHIGQVGSLPCLHACQDPASDCSTICQHSSLCQLVIAVMFIVLCR